MQFDEVRDDRGVVHLAAALTQNPQSVGVRQLRTVRPIRRERVEAIDDREDPGADRNRLALQSRWISSPVPVLVVMPHDRYYGVREIDRCQNVSADGRVALTFWHRSISRTP